MVSSKNIQIYAYLQPWITTDPICSNDSSFSSQKSSNTIQSSPDKYNGNSKTSELNYPLILNKCLQRMIKLSSMELELETVMDLTNLVKYYLNSMNINMSTETNSDYFNIDKNRRRSINGEITDYTTRDSQNKLETKLKSLWDKVSLKLISLKSIDDVEDLEIGFLEIVIGCSINSMIVDLVSNFESSKEQEDTMVEDIPSFENHLDDLLNCETFHNMYQMHQLSVFCKITDDKFKTKIKVDRLSSLSISILYDSNKINDTIFLANTINEITKQKEYTDSEEDLFCSLIKVTNLEDCSTPSASNERETNPLSAMTVESLSLINVEYLPNRDLFKLYGDLFYEKGIKTNLLKQVNNRVAKLVLLYGPPGSGKSALCKVISNLLVHNKLGLLIELSCAQIFSMYLNQSDKNLDQLFNDLSKMLIQYPKLKVILLIDEIETLVRSRQYLMSSTSTNSTIQLVNTMLICLDRVKKFDNLTIFTTSNLIESLDMAFVDRIDFVMKINSPSSSCIYSIIINNLMKLIMNESVIISKLSIDEIKFESFDWCSNNFEFISSDKSILCYKLSLVLKKLKVSGRFLNKACFSCICGKSRVLLTEYLPVLLKTVLDKAQVAHLN